MRYRKTIEPVIIRTGSFTFPHAPGIQLRTDQQTFNFTQTVSKAVSVLTGANFGSSPRNHHHPGRVVVRLSTTIDDDVVTVIATLGVHDWSGDVDDDYEERVDFAVIAELA